MTCGYKGIDCPRAARAGPGAGPSQPADEYGEEALTFTRDLMLQREVGVMLSFCNFKLFCREHAVPGCLRGVFTTRRCTNPLLPYLTLLVVAIHYVKNTKYKSQSHTYRY